MPGFPLAAIGAGLGLFAKQYQEQQAAAERNKMLQMQLAMFQQQMQDRQGQNELANLDPSILSGTPSVQPTPGGASAVPPIGGGMPFASKMPSGGGDGAHWTPAGLAALRPTEGRYDQVHYPSGVTSSGVRSSATGAYGFLDGTWREFAPKAGVDLTQYPRAYMAPPEVQDKVAAITPISHWTGVDKSGRPFNAAAQRLAANPAYIAGGGAGSGGLAPGFARGPEGDLTRNGQPPDATLGGAPAWEEGQMVPGAPANLQPPAGAPRGQQMAQDGPQTATDAGPQGDLAAAEQAELAKIPMPKAGNLDLGTMYRTIRERAPHATAPQIQQLIHNMVAQRGPEATRQFEIEMKQHEEQVATVREKYRELREQQKEQRTGGNVVYGQGNQGFRQQGGVVTPLTRSDTGGPFIKEGAQKVSKNIEVTDNDGKVTFSGAAHLTPEGWVSDNGNLPVAMPGEGNIKLLGIGGQGKTAAAQIQSMIGASEELVGELHNLMELPSTASAGVFQGIQATPGKDLGESMRRTLAGKLTPEENIDVQTSFNAVARAIATIEAQGRATGLVGLTSVSQGMIPQSSDTLGNIWRKYATLRQIMERNTKAIVNSPNISDKQKEEMAALVKEVQQVVPFTVHEVNQLQHGDKETVLQAAQKMGLGGGGKGADTGDGAARSVVIQNGMRFDEKTGEYLGQAQQ
ncbi:MAG TPA: hypothetical protein VNH39_10535 [Steroidobacteraceae bacterium]|nr:hypothetical protein [Steroidobacteraceae bacterium]